MALDLKNVHDLKTLESYLANEGKRFSQPMKPGESPFLDLLQKKVMIFDGGMGTQIFTFNLSLKDFWDKENCVDVLVLSRPDVIEEIHARYYAAGSDCVETDTFGANKVVLAEFGLADKTYEMNVKAVEVARKAAARFNDGKQRFVAGSIGPGTKAVTLGHIDYETLLDSYVEQARGLIDGGVDALLIETQFDLNVAKIAATACLDVMREKNKRVPLMVQVTMETTGTMLMGTEMAAAIVALEALPIDILGMNCATGPELMRQHIEVLSKQCTRYLSVQPNAGLPVAHEGHTHFPLSAEELAKAHVDFVKSFGINIAGGCCGTTPAHIKLVAEALKDIQPVKREAFGRKIVASTAMVSSLYSAVNARQDLSILIVGERTNTNGSKKFKEAIIAEDIDTCAAIGREQVKEGSHVIDVCVDYVGRDGVPDMTKVVQRFAKDVTAPLMIDSTQLDVIEAGLKAAPGKCIVNSINLEDGEEKLAKMCYLLKRYGAAVVAGTIDEDKIEAMGKTADRKIEIARRLYDLLTKKYGLPETDIYFDPLIFPIVTGQEEVRRLAIETIDGIKRISTEFPNCHTTLGLSNVSFGLKPYARMVVNSAFFNECVKAGLTSAIVHASRILPQNKVNPEHYQLAMDLIYDKQSPDYNPLQLLSMLGEAPKTAAAETESLPIEEQLKRHIIDGDKQKLVDHLEEARTKYKPLDIINDHLLAGMKVVGELFGSGQMQLPFVLQSAEVMKSAVAHLEKFMEKVDGQSRGKLVLATVKGDVHDIGKNLVDIILTNNGFTVYNIGIKQPIENVIAKVKEVGADAVGLSGLLVKSTLVMKDDLLELNRQGLHFPVILGGAALTRKYVEADLRGMYKGPLFFGKDAFEGLRVMDAICTGKTKDMLVHTGVSEDRAIAYCGGGLPSLSVGDRANNDDDIAKGPTHSDFAVSDINRNAPIPKAPFFGTRVVKDIPVDQLFPYIDEVALFRGQWQFKSGNKSRDEFREWTEDTVRPIFERIKTKVRELNVLHPAVVYGYFPCYADKNDLIIYEVDASGRPTPKEKLRFHFPRQTDKKRWCLSDFFRPLPSDSSLLTSDFSPDVAAFSCVTMGHDISVYENKLREGGDYTEYLYMHGIGVQMAEALAEMWHKRVRQELGIALHDGPTMRDLFACRYQGCRYSFGYPACPDLEDEVKLFKLLDPERIGCGLTENHFITPEQSTSALITHHPQAKYFNVD
ncbi:MAG TPA: methionine synthase [Phycisphaerae bacterium]|nr:methionine synthase [Phycisphaerae bacterium]